MSYELDSNANGEVRMMYNAEDGAPWHKLGTPLKGLVTAKEALVAAHLDYEVKCVKAYVEYNRKKVEVPDWKAIINAESGMVYGMVGLRYVPMQNKDSFNFFDQVVGEGSAVYSTAGALYGGRRIWIMADLKGSLNIKGDEVKRYVVLVNSHDGTLARQMFWSPIRVVCNNTLEMALSRAANAIMYARHTSGANSKEKVDQAREFLGIANKFFDQWKEKAEYLATHMLPEAKLPLLLKAAFAQPDSIKMEDIYNPVQVQMNKAKELIYSGVGQDTKAIRGTKWQAYNGIVEYADYYRPYRGSESIQKDARLNGAWFGGGSSMKERALNFLMKD